MSVRRGAFGSLAILAVLFAAGPAAAEDRGAWFKSLKQPDTGLSCCDISDCRRTDASFRNGQWFARVEGEMTPIPPNKEVKRTSIDGDAYVCSGLQRKIFCFVPPSMAM